MFARVLRVAAVSLALGGVGFTALAQTDTAPPAGSPAGEDPVVAKVNGAEIRRSEVTRTIASLPPQVQQMPPQMIFPAVIDQIINGKLVAEAGYKNNVQKDPEVAERLKRSEERIVQELYLTREVQKRITAERLQEAYNQFKKENPPQDEVKASHILVDSEDAAKAIIADLKKGGDFAKIAGEKSSDKSAAQQGGDLGYFTKDQMVEPFANAAFAMKPGEISQTPVQTQFGWHVIKVVDRRTAVPSFEEKEPELREQVAREIVNGLVTQAHQGATIQRFNIDGTPKAP